MNLPIHTDKPPRQLRAHHMEWIPICVPRTTAEPFLCNTCPVLATAGLPPCGIHTNIVKMDPIGIFEHENVGRIIYK